MKSGLGSYGTVFSFSKSIITARYGRKVEGKMALKKAEVTRAKEAPRGFAAVSGQYPVTGFLSFRRLHDCFILLAAALVREVCVGSIYK